MSHHDPSEEADAAAAVSVRDHVSVTDGQEGDGDHPQGLHIIAAKVSVIVVPARTNQPHFSLLLTLSSVLLYWLAQVGVYLEIFLNHTG